jgi:hypothetical protein
MAQTPFYGELKEKEALYQACKEAGREEAFCRQVGKKEAWRAEENKTHIASCEVQEQQSGQSNFFPRSRRR